MLLKTAAAAAAAAMSGLKQAAQSSSLAQRMDIGRCGARLPTSQRDDIVMNLAVALITYRRSLLSQTGRGVRRNGKSSDGWDWDFRNPTAYSHRIVSHSQFEYSKCFAIATFTPICLYDYVTNCCPPTPEYCASVVHFFIFISHLGRCHLSQ